MNLRPPAPKAGALPGCAMPRTITIGTAYLAIPAVRRKLMRIGQQKMPDRTDTDIRRSRHTGTQMVPVRPHQARRHGGRTVDGHIHGQAVKRRAGFPPIRRCRTSRVEQYRHSSGQFSWTCRRSIPIRREPGPLRTLCRWRMASCYARSCAPSRRPR